MVSKFVQGSTLLSMVEGKEHELNQILSLQIPTMRRKLYLLIHISGSSFRIRKNKSQVFHNVKHFKKNLLPF